MYISSFDKTNLLRRLPNIELSYESIAYKKVHNADVYLAIPFGKKYLLWYTYYKKENVCLLIELLKNDKLGNIFIHNTFFSNELALGTLAYGTLVSYNNINYFSIEDIFYVKGKPILNPGWSHKLNILKDLFIHDIKQFALTNNNLIVGLPAMHTNYNTLTAIINSLPYNVYAIQSRNMTSDFNIKNFIYKNIIKHVEAIFKVKPSIQADIYYLYYSNQDETKLLDSNIAHIPSYKISVLLNSLFRNIKENRNLDTLEESDSDDDFEDTSLDKFVDLNKSYDMLCNYSFKFKRWVPIRQANKSEKRATKYELDNLLLRNNY